MRAPLLLGSVPEEPTPEINESGICSHSLQGSTLTLMLLVANSANKKLSKIPGK